jgi:hypothetical protein
MGEKMTVILVKVAAGVAVAVAVVAREVMRRREVILTSVL